jgi:parvulin-like peptidyl-prolyl isomerase
LVSPSSAIYDPEVLAIVEGRRLPAKFYRMYLENGIEVLGLDQGGAERRQELELLKEGIVSELIDHALIEAEAERRGLRASEAELDAACQSEFARMGGRQAALAYYLRHGITEQEFRAAIRQQLLAQLLRERLSTEVFITDEEVRDFYSRQRRNPQFASLMIEPERVRARHILIEARRALIEAELKSKQKLSEVELSKRVEDQMRRRRDRALKVLNAIERGADFGLMARLHSDDLGTRDRGGDLGLFTRYSHTAGFDEVAFDLRPGQMSQPIQTEYGYHI